MSKPNEVRIRSSTTEYLQNIFATGELEEKAVCRDFRHTAEDGKEYPTFRSIPQTASAESLQTATLPRVLCHRKNDALVELTLPPDANIFASKYQLYLPSKEELKNRLTQITHELEGGHQP